MTYTEAYNQLQTIIEKLKGEDISIDEMKGQIVKAKELIAYCQNKLREIELDLEDEE